MSKENNDYQVAAADIFKRINELSNAKGPDSRRPFSDMTNDEAEALINVMIDSAIVFAKANGTRGLSQSGVYSLYDATALAVLGELRKARNAK